MNVNRAEYRSKVLGCWMGKNIGGTLGAPMEWRRQINDVSFYTQKLGGEPLPNDDLDIQLAWLIALEEQGPDLDANTLAEYWLLYVAPHWSEYGNAKGNLRAGLLPPLSGSIHNDFKHSCGSFIRSEIWACVTPACPAAAAWYALQDAIIDHGDGEGTYAEVLCAVMESAAFVESDVQKLLDIGLSYLPPDSAVAAAVRTARECYSGGRTWLEARDTILEHYRGATFFNHLSHTSDRDREKGFHTGRLGYDVPSNIGMLVIALLYGEGDFDKTLCTAVNCGEDTDCTAATVGSLFGILHGIEAIPQRWIDPIGRGIKTIALNVGDCSWQLAKTVDELTDRTERAAHAVLHRRRLPVRITDNPTDRSGLNAERLFARDGGASLYWNLGGPVFRFDQFEIGVDYLDGPFARDAQPKTIRLKIRNTYRVQSNLNVRWYVPDGWEVHPGSETTLHVASGALGDRVDAEYALQAPCVGRSPVRMAIEITRDGWPMTMLVPVTLLNGNAEQTPETGG